MEMDYVLRSFLAWRRIRLSCLSRSIENTVPGLNGSYRPIGILFMPNTGHLTISCNANPYPSCASQSMLLFRIGQEVAGHQSLVKAYQSSDATGPYRPRVGCNAAYRRDPLHLIVMSSSLTFCRPENI